MVEFSSNTRFEAEPTAPMVTSPPMRPKLTDSEPLVVSILKRGEPVEDVAIVHAYGELLGIVVVDFLPKLNMPPLEIERTVVEAESARRKECVLFDVSAPQILSFAYGVDVPMPRNPLVLFHVKVEFAESRPPE